MVDRPIERPFRLGSLPDDRAVVGKDLKEAFGEHIEDDHAGVTGTEIKMMLDEHSDAQATMKWVIEFLFGKVVMNPVTNERSFDGTGVLSDFALARDRGEKPQIVINSARYEPTPTVKWAIGAMALSVIALLSMLVWAAVVMITGQPIDPPGFGL